MSTLILYGNRYSGHSYKVRLALMLADISHDYVHVDISLPRGERPEDFRAASRFGEVPVLVADGVPLCQSNAILQWLADSYGALGGALGERQRVREWLNWETNRLACRCPICGVPRLPLRRAEVEAWLEKRLRADLAVLERNWRAPLPGRRPGQHRRRVAVRLSVVAVRHPPRHRRLAPYPGLLAASPPNRAGSTRTS
ncbi:maleylacetoacetate isomerase [Chromobacterium violaceum]|uniref:Maleylacetoacetate isomerase n=1 Tax=Chromobacterium violaceum TaxID=536 RepID=A0A447T7I9_CHRVL|nr:maleylacetoacetate isomerase [Chromobacterium violaceum]